ncbi:hypothetical protein G7Y89_g9427 [Cudoniella acicularis]|uniref:Scytalone dehydratase-like protein Arp1 N-terminal domain-containing protein n=1 Tax=Cudoniella acicularis TaxID=354080 RepID=A0A8H4W020_9HELO|nr:hypothetical protein G7Y89_g9427 [Cudoniella acicularis]
MLPKPFSIGPARFIALQPSKLKDIIAKYKELDDVFRVDFLSDIIFTGSPKVEFAPRAYELLQSLGTRWIEVADTANSASNSPPGLYYVIDKQLHDIWKLYEDSRGAFLTALVPGVDGRLSQLQIGGEDIQTIMVAVPSCLQTTISVCNRAFYELYPPASQTAACIKFLEGKGTRILGTTKLAAFVATEEPIECVDYQAPWNPRADGHQSQQEVVAAVVWQLLLINGWTSPSALTLVEAVEGQAIGMDALHIDLPSFEQFDMPTFFSRTVGICREFAEHWYGDKLPHNRSSLPLAIIYPTEYMSFITNKDQFNIIDDFTADIEKSLGFREDCQRAFKKTPYVSPPVRWQWNLSAGITKEERDISVHRLSVYEKWCSEKVLQIGTYNTIILIPIENMTPRYRDKLLAPEFTVPIGEVPFLSKVTGNVEQLLVAISLLGAPGTPPNNDLISKVSKADRIVTGRDLEFMDIARDCLVKAGRPTCVLAGTKLFP